MNQTTTDLLPIGMLVEVHAPGNQWDGCEGRIADQRVRVEADSPTKNSLKHYAELYGVRLEDYGVTLTFARELLAPLGSVQRGGAARLL